MKGLCFGCYGSDHIAKFCKQRRTCQTCKKRHPTTLHDPNWKPGFKNNKNDKEKDSNKTTSEAKDVQIPVNNARATVCDITEAGDSPINMSIIPVWLYHKDNPDERVAVYALLDNASGGTFIKEETLEKLHVKGNDTKLLLTTMHGTKEVSTKAVEGLVMEHFQRDKANVQLPRTYVRQQIPADRDEIPRTELLDKWPHLKKIAMCIPAYMENVEVGILIGLNCPSALRPRDVIHGNEDEPYAVKSLLGWHINGPVNRSTCDAVLCNRVHIMTNSSNGNAKGYVTVERKIKEIITPNTIKEIFEMEFSERERGMGLSQGWDLPW